MTEISFLLIHHIVLLSRSASARSQILIIIYPSGTQYHCGVFSRTCPCCIVLSTCKNVQCCIRYPFVTRIRQTSHPDHHPSTQYPTLLQGLFAIMPMLHFMSPSDARICCARHATNQTCRTVCPAIAVAPARMSTLTLMLCVSGRVGTLL